MTGSCHLLEVGRERILFDCGLFQGSRVLEARNALPLGFEATRLQAFFLSHAHLDHAGRVPILLREGYSGPIYATRATRELFEPLMLDAAKIQREDFERDQRKGRHAEAPLFDDRDVELALERFEEIDYHEVVEVGSIRVQANIAGHIPGSASFFAQTSEGRFVFSGDLGTARKDVMPDPEVCPDADVVLVESTYGDRDHRDFEQTLEELAAIVRQAEERRGKIIIPSAALERTQDLLYNLARLEEAGRIPTLPVFVDSPLAGKIERVYEQCQKEFSSEVQALFKAGDYPFAPAKLRYTRSVEESKALNVVPGSAIIIAGAGMLMGGRVLHHLRHNLPDPSTTVVIVGYQPEGGLGRQLIDGFDRVKLFGDLVRVRAQIATIGGLSAHADQSELFHWLENAKSAEIRLVHGEEKTMLAFKKALEERDRRVSIQEPAIPLPVHKASTTDGE